MLIRQERKEDYSAVHKLVKAAFDTTDFSDGTEAEYLDNLRKLDTFIPELSLIAHDKDNRILGQIVLYEMTIKSDEADYKELVLSPISVHPNHFGKGIARALIEEACLIAVQLGYKAVFLCGNPELYTRLGFTPSYKMGIYHVNDGDKNAEWCMVKELVKDSLKSVSGLIAIE
jgi:predicted N-acetyltransferase YhbS